MKTLQKEKISHKKTTQKVISERKFWQQIALQQQAILHAKNHT